MNKVLQRLHYDLGKDLNRIAERFKNPKLTLIVRNPDVADGDVVLTSEEDIELAITAMRRFQAEGPNA